MKQISEIIEAKLKELAMQSKSLPQKETLPSNWVSAIFLKMQSRYGARWTSAIDGIEKAALKEWSEGLAGMTGENIKAGLEFDGDWPPTLPEFKKACLGQTSGTNEYGLDYIPQYYRVVETDKTKLLLSDERDAGREMFKENMQNLKNKLRGKQ